MDLPFLPSASYNVFSTEHPDWAFKNDIMWNTFWSTCPAISHFTQNSKLKSLLWHTSPWTIHASATLHPTADAVVATWTCKLFLKHIRWLRLGFLSSDCGLSPQILIVPFLLLSSPSLCPPNIIKQTFSNSFLHILFQPHIIHKFLSLVSSTTLKASERLYFWPQLCTHGLEQFLAHWSHSLWVENIRREQADYFPNVWNLVFVLLSLCSNRQRHLQMVKGIGGWGRKESIFA